MVYSSARTFWLVSAPEKFETYTHTRKTKHENTRTLQHKQFVPNRAIDISGRRSPPFLFDSLSNHRLANRRFLDAEYTGDRPLLPPTCPCLISSFITSAILSLWTSGGGAASAELRFDPGEDVRLTMILLSELIIAAIVSGSATSFALSPRLFRVFVGPDGVFG